MLKIRLARFGKKRVPFYRIVVVEARSKRNGFYNDQIGTYNPLTEPSTIIIDKEKALKWMKSGAQPTDTVYGLFAKEGIVPAKESGDLKRSPKSESKKK